MTILLFLVFCTGCWNRKELSEIAVVGAAAVDLEDNGLKLTCEIIKPKKYESKESNALPVTYFQSEGKSIFEAVRQVTETSSKKLFWSHANVYLFNEKAAQSGLIKYLDFYNRDHEARRYVHVGIVKDKSAFEGLEYAGEKDNIPSAYLEDLFENYKANGKGVSIKLIDFLKAYYAEGIEPVCCVIQIVKRTNPQIKTDKDPKENLTDANEGLAIFREDNLIGFLDGEQTRAFNFITNKLKSTIIVSKSIDEVGLNGVEVIKSSSKLDVKLVEGTCKASVKIEINGVLDEETGKENISNLQAIKKVEEKTSQIIKSEVEATIKKVQAYQSDVFGFGQIVHIKYPVEWRKMKKNWNEIFSTLKIDVSVKVNMRGAGVMNKQMESKERN